MCCLLSVVCCSLGVVRCLLSVVCRFCLLVCAVGWYWLLIFVAVCCYGLRVVDCWFVLFVGVCCCLYLFVADCHARG